MGRCYHLAYAHLWFQLPHKLKEYIGVVFQNGQGKLFASDGRTRTNPEVNYGIGGLLQNKKKHGYYNLECSGRCFYIRR